MAAIEYQTQTEKNRIKRERARRRRRLKMLGISAVILPLLGGGLYTLGVWSVPTGKPAPPITLENQNGQKVTLEDFRGKQGVALLFYMVAT